MAVLLALLAWVLGMACLARAVALGSHFASRVSAVLQCACLAFVFYALTQLSSPPPASMQTMLIAGIVVLGATAVYNVMSALARRP